MTDVIKGARAPQAPRRLSIYTRGGLTHTLTNDRQNLPADSPRRKPTLAKLKFMDGPDPDDHGEGRR
jgi:hypothetical protein